jgi:hypothetical protein
MKSILHGAKETHNVIHHNDDPLRFNPWFLLLSGRAGGEDDDEFDKGIPRFKQSIPSAHCFKQGNVVMFMRLL